MTKQHFIYLANAMKCERPGDNWDANKKVQWDLCIKALANSCKHFNAKFDKNRFITACGGLFNA